jgi:hypothetical protein
VAGLRGTWPVVALLATVALSAGCSQTNPAGDFCSSYGKAFGTVVAAARQYATDPAVFASTYKSTMDNIGEIRAKAPDDTLRAAFDKSMFTFTVFGSDADLAEFLTRADFSTNAVVIACADYGVTVTV